MIRRLALLLLVIGCGNNYCPNGPVVFAVDDPRLLPAVESAVEQLSEHMPVRLAALATELVTSKHWRDAEVWRVVTVTDDDPRTIACDPLEDDPGASVAATTVYEDLAIYVCDRHIGFGRITSHLLHEVGHAVGGPVHSDDPRDIMHIEPANRSTYTSNDVALLTATCG